MDINIMTDIQKRVIRTIATVPGVKANIESRTMGFEQLGLDSLDVVSLVYDIEEEFDITIPDGDVFELETLGDVVAGVKKLVAEKQASPAVKIATQ